MSPVQSKTLSPVDAFELLRNARNPALILDVRRGHIVASNAPAARLFGFDPDDCPPNLEAAMPALEYFRQIVRGGEPCVSKSRPFEFWTKRGTEVFECYVSLVTEPGASENVLVMIPGTAMANTTVDQPRPTMDDAATLREIAKRIREGSRMLAAENGGPVMSGPALKDEKPPSGDEPREPAPEAPSPPVAPEQREAKTPPISEPEIRSPPQTAAMTDDLARLAHELRTPLSAIAAASEIMRDERLGEIGNERYKGYAADIHAGAKHALAVIERLLTHATAAPADKPPSGMRLIDLNELATETISTMLPLSDKAGLLLSGELQPGLPELFADPVSLKQIMLNLLTNSLKFSEAGANVSLRTWQASDGAISLSVADTGKGMSKSEIHNALSSHARPASKPGPQGGLGIGLPLVRSLVEENRGTLNIESTPGRGTTITIRFPRQRMIAV